MASIGLPQPSSVTIILLFLILYPLKSTANVGITVDLIPRDSSLSPSYNASKTHFDRLHDAFERSLQRVNNFKRVLTDPEASKFQTQVISSERGGEFLVNISIGTPPFEVLGEVDTGSDLTWTQCLPCSDCFQQKLPIFNPKHSSTYKTVSCESSSCDAQYRAGCNDETKTCEYVYAYADDSYSFGDLSSDTFTIGSEKPASLRNITFGCAHKTAKTFDESMSSLEGLGGGKISFISQIGESVGKRFSYCPVPFSNTSKVVSRGTMSFGSDAVVSGSGVVTTPIVKNATQDTFYYLTLEGISVGNKRIPYKSSADIALNDDEGNIIIDSGTTLTFLPSVFYADLETAVDEAIGGKKVDDPSLIFSLCYDSSRGKLKIPILTAHFKGGDVKLQPYNTFIEVAEHMVCFAMVANYPPVYGNWAQRNFLVGYDLEARKVSFLPEDCTKH